MLAIIIKLRVVLVRIGSKRSGEKRSRIELYDLQVCIGAERSRLQRRKVYNSVC